MKTALTRDYKETVMARIKRDRKFARALYVKPANALLKGETAEVRQYLSQRLIQKMVYAPGMKEIFSKSQSWKGYDSACDSWHVAFWSWVDKETPGGGPEQFEVNWKLLNIFDLEKWARQQGVDLSKLPCPAADRKVFLLELSRQEYLQRLALFALLMRGPEAKDPKTYQMFSDDSRVANQIGDRSFFAFYARQKHIKRAKDTGDRRLKHLLLLSWIPGCLWAFTTDGVAQFLNAHYPRSGNKLYNNKTISDACRNLKLCRSRSPLYWGLTGSPPRLVPLR